MKTLAVTLLATVATIGAAQADDMDVYQTCWAEASTAVLNSKGVTEETLKEAVLNADGMCEYQRISVMASGQSPKEMRSYMEVQLYNANPVQETQVAAVSPSMKPYEAPRYTPKREFNLFNVATGFLCTFPTDVDNARQLVESGRSELVAQIGGCVAFDKTIEVEEVDRFGWTRKVRYISPEGKLITAFTSERTFKTRSEWTLRACQRAGNEWSGCLDAVYKN
ncbi:hypothetical protein BCY90_03190 [Agrobacterium deltaense]|uniref:hypothetical protein n=1 Tax=Agrobacterium TaxID=357 RepID=UPI000B22E8B5|nr:MULTISPECIES: hypothetical protein [Agrobacterium]RKF37760.1 hypothetical protein BCY90_03190 [Agrobacterium deltaense]